MGCKLLILSVLCLSAAPSSCSINDFDEKLSSLDPVFRGEGENSLQVCALIFHSIFFGYLMFSIVSDHHK